jgi:hypothetical protein
MPGLLCAPAATLRPPPGAAFWARLAAWGRSNSWPLTHAPRGRAHTPLASSCPHAILSDLSRPGRRVRSRQLASRVPPRVPLVPAPWCSAPPSGPALPLPHVSGPCPTSKRSAREPDSAAVASQTPPGPLPFTQRLGKGFEGRTCESRTVLGAGCTGVPGNCTAFPLGWSLLGRKPDPPKEAGTSCGTFDSHPVHLNVRISS